VKIPSRNVGCSVSCRLIILCLESEVATAHHYHACIRASALSLRGTNHGIIPASTNGQDPQSAFSNLSYHQSHPAPPVPPVIHINVILQLPSALSKRFSQQISIHATVCRPLAGGAVGLWVKGGRCRRVERGKYGVI
jgi:hypothetical protein